MGPLLIVIVLIAIITWKSGNSRSSTAQLKECSKCHLVKRISRNDSECLDCLQWKSSGKDPVESVEQIDDFRRPETSSAFFLGKIMGNLSVLLKGRRVSATPISGSYLCEGCSTRRTADTRGKDCPVCNPKPKKFEYPFTKCANCGNLRNVYQTCVCDLRNTVKSGNNGSAFSEPVLGRDEIQPPPFPNASLNLSKNDWDMLQFPIEELERQTPWDPMSYKELWRESSEGIQFDYGVKALELAGTAGKAISSDPYYVETLNTAMGLNCKSIHFEISQSHRIDRMSVDLGGKSFPAFGVSINAATHLGILDLSPEKVHGSLAWELGAVIDSDGILVPVMIIASRLNGVDEIAVIGLLNVVLFPEVKEVFAHLFSMRMSGDKDIPGFEEGLIATSRLGLIIRGLEGGLDIRMSEHVVPMRYWLNISQAVFLLRTPKTVIPRENDFKLFCLGGLPEGESVFSSMSSGKFECWY